jgi:hypothetical protein
MAKKVITGLCYHIPKQFTENEVLDAYLQNCGLSNVVKHRGKLCYLLNHLRVTSHLQKDRYNTNNWVSIDTSIMRKIYGDLKYFYQIMRKLESDGLVEVYKNAEGKESYQTGKSCKKYRLLPLIDDLEWKAVRFSASTCTTTQKVILFGQKNWESIDFDLYSIMQNFQLDQMPFFEDTQIENFITSNYPETKMIRDLAELNVSRNNKKRKGKRQLFTVETSMREIYKAYKDMYAAMRLGGTSFRHQPDKYGRRHTNITNLPKFLRKQLYVIKNGEKRYLKEVDVKNSQVLLLLMVLDNSLDGYEKFKNLVESGMFYEFLWGKLGHVEPLSERDRQETKKKFFTFVYGDAKEAYIKEGAIRKVLYAEFPALVDFIESFKDANDYETPAQLMQMVESDIIIQYVSKKAVEIGLIFTQIYDSILCLEEDLETFNDLIKDGFKVYGLQAMTNIDLGNQSNLSAKTFNAPAYFKTTTSA